MQTQQTNNNKPTHFPECQSESEIAIKRLASIKEKDRLLLMATVVSVAVVLHNIPEGMATYVASFHSVSAGAPLAIAIAGDETMHTSPPT